MQGDERPSDERRRVAPRPGPLRLTLDDGVADPPRALLVIPSSHDGERPPTDGVAAGPLPRLLTRGGMIVAVDGGVADLRALGCVPDVLVGDLDSASPDDVAWAERAGAEVQRHPTDKDATDLALALAFARRQGALVVDVVGGGGGRVDHLFGTALACTHASVAPMTVLGHLTRTSPPGDASFAVLHDASGVVGVEADPGTPFSLLAPRGARGITVEGARWPLDDAELEAGSTLGISNEVAGSDTGRNSTGLTNTGRMNPVRITCRSGPLVVVVG